MTLKNLIPQKPNIQTVILSLTFLLAYLLAGTSEARALSIGYHSWQSGALPKTPTGTPPDLLVSTAAPPPLETAPITPTEVTVNQDPAGQLGTAGKSQNYTLFLPNLPMAAWKKIIKNREFTKTLDLDTGDNNTLILNATFHDITGSGITLRNVSNVYIKNCIIHNVGEDGIVLRSTGSTHNVTIEGCTIYNTGRSGILSKQQEETGIDHTNLVIKNNTLYNIGTTVYDHGMYIFSRDSTVERNVIYGVAGNGISIRSSGLVRRNKVWDTQKSCIRYHGNHARGASNALIIENNLCYQSETGTGDAGIGLSREENTPESWLVGTYIIRFNTVVQLTAGRYGFAVDSPVFDPRRVEVYGNLFVNVQNISKTLKPNYVDYRSSNYSTTYLKEFVDPAHLLHGFQLRNDSRARSYASKEPRFPAIDINGTFRPSGKVDAGAYQSTVQ